jgi:hypothetical protein
MQLSDLQLLEGLADQYSGGRGDILEITGGWRYSAAKVGVPLQLFAMGNGFQLPLSRHILRCSEALKKQLTERQ